ncbi:hypothetical protein [Hymenobacter sp. GOD-10R]|uniref:hypothetical protein n=1 Tax=Hymenobacter sp. GOD-10R TaxID=3093922 RepID=UPI002D767E3C|nr:hypothetical protein [Hymenobacter sp. GOD-10R]WRQ30164.1 hypothetical protein SD425_07805 [Hymenobacter sp. GOD-10R]
MKLISTRPRAFAARLLLGAGLLFASACSLDLPNPNASDEDRTLNTREGLYALSIGLRQVYSTSALEPIILTTGTTARELKGVTTFTNITEIEQGGTLLPPNNGNVTALYARCYRVILVADQILNAAPATLSAEAPARSAVLAHAYLFKAAALAGIAQGFEQGPITTSLTAPPFVTRQALLTEAVRLLDLATQELAANPIPTDFSTQVLGSTFNLPNTVQAYRARFNLRAGNYAAARTAANLVNLTARSTFTYSAQSPNPIFQNVVTTTAVVGTGNFRSRENLGLPAALVIPGDKRLDFYLAGPTTVNSTNGSTDNVRLLAGFFTSQTAEIPTYLPDEMRLIRAETYLRQATPDLAAALVDINAVRTQTSGDPFLVHPGLPAYSGPETVDALLLEVYKQRCAELYLSGQRLEDSRRFGRPAPPASLVERTRNFYPYPQQERVNNTNTPADPAI